MKNSTLNQKNRNTSENIYVGALMQGHIFNTVTDVIFNKVTGKKQPDNFSKKTSFKHDLDLTNLDIAELLFFLEQITLMDLNVSMNSIRVVGDVCDLIEKKIKQIDKSQQDIMLQKLNNVATMRIIKNNIMAR